MTRISDEARREVVCTHVQDRRTIASLIAECSISRSIVFNWVRLYREEYQDSDKEESQLEMMEELRRLRRERVELEKENSFLKKQWHSSRRESISGVSST